MDGRQRSSDEPPTAVGRGGAGVALSRRRFARAGLSGSVVLGSLASKPVLGAAPYHCTVSGQVSGNISPRPDSGATCVIGSPRSFWLTSTNWPSPINRGTRANSNCTFNGQTFIRGTNFNGYSNMGTPALASAFFNNAANGTCSVVLTTTANPPDPATMLQVLANTNTTDRLFEFGRTIVVSLLNSYAYAPNYPVNDATIIAMFNSTYLGGSYQVNSTVAWTRSQVMSYLQSLYPFEAISN
jgi:hypothetical protein